MPPYRNSYIEQHLTDDESSESASSYMDDFHMRRKNDHRDSTGRSIRSSRNSLQSSPQRNMEFDDDSETFSRRSSYRERSNPNRERRASSSARSASARSEKRQAQRVRSDSTQDSETEMGTRALVQAKIREKVAQASSLDESSSDFWKPKAVVEEKIQKTQQTSTKPTTNATKPQQKSKERQSAKEKTKVEKVKTEIQATPPPPVEKLTLKETPTETANEENTLDLNSIPDSAPTGPPPSTPNYEWECEFCTFTNEPNTKICAICCKTPSTTAIRKQPSENKLPPSGKINESTEISKEGRTRKISRKISFWPGTKAK